MPRATLKMKLVRTMVLMLSAVAVILIGLLVSVSVRFSNRNLSTIEEHHRTALQAKAHMLAENHGAALKGLVLDNAFGDIHRLVQRTVTDDRDLVYGLFTTEEGRVLAFAGPGAPADRPDPKAFVRLGLAEFELNVKQETTRKTDLFGENVVEVAAPVRDGSETLGTIRYGLSTRRMRDALHLAQAESQRDIVRSLALSLGVALLAAAIAALMSRRAAERVAKPVMDLASAAKALAGGRRDVQVDIRSNDEVQDLGDAFNQMVADLKTSYDSLEDLNRNLEKKVELRTNELAGRNRDMRLVLDNVEEGFLTLSAEGVMALEHSSILDRWFGGYAERTTFSKYVEGTDAGFAAYFDLGWESIVDGFLPLDLCIDQLPRKIVARGSTWHVRYTPIMSSGKLDGVLVVIQDITAELARRKEELEQRSIMAAFQRLMRDRTGFLAFYRETSALVDNVVGTVREPDMVVLKRVIHTIKGNSSMFGIEHVAVVCHQLENEIAESGEPPNEAGTAELARAWGVIADNVARVTEGAESKLEVPREDIHALVASLRMIPAARHLATVVESWRREPIQVPLRRLGEQATALARRLGKGEISVNVQAEMIRCDVKRWAPFWSDAVHVVRNAIDHGLETPEEREQAGKRAPTLAFKAGWENQELVISIADDGRGVDLDRIREKAQQLQLPHETKEDLMAVLFMDGVSSRSEATEFSGRGVGMSAIKHRVESMGGRITIESERGRGTIVTCRFPRHESLQAFTLRPVDSAGSSSISP